jgi:hypothetical protein
MLRSVPRWRRLFGLLALVPAILPASARASEVEALRARAAALERRVAALERELAAGLRCDPEGWRRGERWARLRRGMSRFDVLSLLGEPGKVASYDGFERWEYPDLLGGRVHFDDRGELQGWVARPDASLRRSPSRQRASRSR